MLKQSGALLVHLRQDKLFEITIPSKTQAYMAIGEPILMTVAGDSADLVTRSVCGVVEVPEDVKSIASAATALFRSDRGSLQRMGEPGRRYYDERLALQVGAARFAELLQRLAGGRSGSASC